MEDVSSLRLEESHPGRCAPPGSVRVSRFSYLAGRCSSSSPRCPGLTVRHKGPGCRPGPRRADLDVIGRNLSLALCYERGGVPTVPYHHAADGVHPA